MKIPATEPGPRRDRGLDRRRPLDQRHAHLLARAPRGGRRGVHPRPRAAGRATAATRRTSRRSRASSSRASTPRPTAGSARSGARTCRDGSPSTTRSSRTSTTSRRSPARAGSALAAAGARPQRCLWASTSTKNPAYRDVLYVEELIGPDTVNTMPFETIAAFQDHGEVRETLTEGVDEAKALLDELAAAGVDYDDVTDDARDGRASRSSRTRSRRCSRASTRSAPFSRSSSRRVAESGEQLVVEEAVRGDGASAVDRGSPVEIREPPAGLLDDHLHRREIPLADAERVRQRRRRTLRRSACTARSRRSRARATRAVRSPARVLDREREHGVLDPRDGRDVDRLAVRERARSALGPPAPRERRSRDDAELHHAVHLECDRASPRRGFRASSSACRRSGRRSSAASRVPAAPCSSPRTASSGRSSREDPAQLGLDRAIGLGHGGEVGLHLDREAGAEVRQRDRIGCVGEATRELEVGAHWPRP